MGGPWNDYATPQNVAGMVAAEASRQGVDPDLAVRLAKQESGFNHAARSPKGAIGVMQLMPDTAKSLGVDPTDLSDNIRGGVTYLKQQGDRFGSPRLAAAAYNAGPGAVAQHGGVPPFKETQDYVNAVAPGGSDQTPPWMDYAPPQAQAVPEAAPEAPPMAPDASPAPQAAPQSGFPGVFNPETQKPYNPAQQAGYKALFDAGKLDPNAGSGSEAFPRGLTDEKDTPNPGDWYMDLKGQIQQAPGANYGRDSWEGFSQPFAKISDDIGQAYHHTMAGDASIGDIPKIGMDALGAFPAGVIGAITRPAADAARQVLPTPYAKPRLTMRDGKVVVDGPRPLHGTEALDATQNILDTSIGGLRAAAPTRAASAMESLGALKPADLPAASKKAWDAVDASTYRVPKSDLLSASDDIAAALAEHGGADLYPKAAQIAARVRSLAGADEDMTIGKLNRLKSQAGMKLLGPGSDEVDLGGVIKDRLEKVILDSKDPSIGPARDLYTRLKKVEAVNNAIETADNSAQGKAAIPAQLRPYLKPNGSQQIRNLTPEERSLMKSIVKGGSQMDPLRMISNFRLNGPISGPILGGLAVPTHGLSVGVGIAGNVAKVANEASAAAKVQRLLDLMASGGKTTAAAPISPTLALGGRPPVPWASPRGLIGASAGLQLLNPRPEAGH